MVKKPSSGLVLFAHGSRDARWKSPFMALEKKMASRLPGALVKAAFLQDCEPKIHDVVDSMAAKGLNRITVIPMFLAVGAHSANDFPKIAERLRAAHPGVEIEWTEVIGQWEEAQDALAETMTAQLAR